VFGFQKKKKKQKKEKKKKARRANTKTATADPCLRAQTGSFGIGWLDRDVVDGA
jgi:hypothetical protein